MILYYSGTGNSRFVAERLAEQLGEEVQNIETFTTKEKLEGESIGLIFPVYAWGVPHIVQTFIRQCLAQFYTPNTYLYAIITCGDDIGFADRELQDILQQTLQHPADSIFSVQMTETYICLPGFDVDTKEEAQKKVSKATERLAQLAQRIKHREAAIDVYRGPIPNIYHYVLRPIFRRWLMTDRYFHVDASRCTGCGLCTKSCPAHDIRLSDGLPQWKNDTCEQCLRCYHHCPTRAIDWGRFTQGKKQALSPFKMQFHKI